MGVPLVPAPSSPSAGCPADDSDPLQQWILARSVAAGPDEVWALVQAGRVEPGRPELYRAALDLADELGCHAAARRVTVLAAAAIRRSPGCRTVAGHLPGVALAFAAEALAADAALAVLLAERLSPEIRDILLAPWASVFGHPEAAPS
jgi:hypothetical protein